MKSVCVLLSTYNGEKYLRQQLDSLLAQEGIALSVLVRDDGSSDSTRDILKEYAEGRDNFSFYPGENLGPAKSFFDLIRNAPEADYYAFCDQDDVWDPDKLSIAVGMLEKEDSSKPDMYYSNLRIVDSDLNFYRLAHGKPKVQSSKYSVLAEDIATGCTIVFNRTAEEMMRPHLPEGFSMHDTWVYLICRIFGAAVYDFEAHISYRQHGGNVIGVSLGKRSLQIYRERFFRLFNRELQPHYHNACSLYEAFGDQMSPEDARMVLKMVRYKDSPARKLSLLFEPRIHATDLSREVRYRILILLGIV